MSGWIQRLKRRHHKSTFLRTLDELDRFKALVSREECPTCGQNGLELVTFTRNAAGWDASVSCGNCNFRGVVNSNGFEFHQINSKGKARD